MPLVPSLEESASSRQALELSGRLIDAGLRLAEQLSFARLSEPVLAQAGAVSVVDFRNIFGDLEGYLQVLQLHINERQGAALQAGMDADNASPAEKLRGACDQYLETSMRSQGARRWIETFSRQSAPLRACVRRHGLSQARRLEPALANGLASARAASRLLLAAVREVADAEAAQGAALPPLREAVYDFIQCWAAGAVR